MGTGSLQLSNRFILQKVGLQLIFPFEKEINIHTLSCLSGYPQRLTI